MRTDSDVVLPFPTLLSVLIGPGEARRTSHVRRGPGRTSAGIRNLPSSLPVRRFRGGCFFFSVRVCKISHSPWPFPLPSLLLPAPPSHDPAEEAATSAEGQRWGEKMMRKSGWERRRRGGGAFTRAGDEKRGLPYPSLVEDVKVKSSGADLARALFRPSSGNGAACAQGRKQRRRVDLLGFGTRR